jgi:hypothetical protein
MSDSVPHWSRRAALGSAIGAALGGTTTSLSAAAQRFATLPTNDPAFNVQVIGKLQGDLSERTTYTYNPGFVYGIVPREGRAPDEFARLLYAVEGVTQRISRLLVDGSVEESSRSWMVYRDAASGTHLTEFRNPYTNELLKVPPVRGGPSRARLTQRGPITESFPGLENTSFNKPLDVRWRLLGDSAWIARHSASRIRTSTGTLRNEFSIDAWVCKRADLQRTRATHIPSTCTWTSHAEWQSWLNMERHPGHLLWRIEPTVLLDARQIPTELIEVLDRVAPGQFAEPLRW